MSRPASEQPWLGESLERGVEDVLRFLRPFPPADEMLIGDLTEEEDQLFMAVVVDA
jgi:hypothetical protein